ncbi:MAG: hypothetical protein GW911_00795 [Armatimonadetes bacterium]|nr:hypothetical protein [Armatimonadota bacterium]NCO93357.1 hypothetical protein [Armatimonadota bacterium]NCP33367.1 hypothetical protein [Armatimonadota bacterium]NDK10581.1 hypothetical protein [Armatimonadota bacterium]
MVRTWRGVIVLLALVTSSVCLRGGPQEGGDKDIVKTLLMGIEHRSDHVDSGRGCRMREVHAVGKDGELSHRLELRRWAFRGSLYRDDTWPITPWKGGGREITYRVTGFDGEQYYEFEQYGQSNARQATISLSPEGLAVGGIGRNYVTGAHWLKQLSLGELRLVGRERLRGHECYRVVQTFPGDGPDQAATVDWWIAPEIDFTVVKWVLRKPFASGERRGIASHAIEALRVDQVGGLWLDTLVRQDRLLIDENGGQQRIKLLLDETRDVELGIEPASSWFLYDFPLGTRVSNEIKGGEDAVGGSTQRAEARLKIESMEETERAVSATTATAVPGPD